MNCCALRRKGRPFGARNCRTDLRSLQSAAGPVNFLIMTFAPVLRNLRLFHPQKANIRSSHPEVPAGDSRTCDYLTSKHSTGDKLLRPANVFHNLSRQAMFCEGPVVNLVASRCDVGWKSGRLRVATAALSVFLTAHLNVPLGESVLAHCLSHIKRCRF
jgi:hypothetical protein